jgi:hypothetical protein
MTLRARLLLLSLFLYACGSEHGPEDGEDGGTLPVVDSGAPQADSAASDASAHDADAT